MSTLKFDLTKFSVRVISSGYPLVYYTGFHVVILPIFIFINSIRFLKFSANPKSLFFVCLIAYMALRSIAAIADESVIRVIAALYNVIIFSSGVLLYFLISKNRRFRYYIVEGYSNLFLITVISYQLIYLYSITSTSYGLEHPSLLGLLAGNTDLPGILESAKSVVYTRLEWGFGDVIPRMVFLAEFPTTAALLLLITHQFYLLKRLHRSNIYIVFIVDLIVLISLLYTQSRVLTVAFVFATVIYYLFKFRKFGFFRFMMKILSPVLVIAISLGLLNLTIYLSGFRESSGDARFTSYLLGINMVLDKNFIFGLGVKPHSPIGLHIPIGSHSTFISLFVKYGIIGILAIVGCLIIYPFKLALMSLVSEKVSDAKKIFIIRTFPILLLWMAFQDIDAYVIASFLVFSCLAIYGSSYEV